MESEESSEGDFKKIEIIQKKNKKQKTSNEIVLQSQVLELQMKVNALGIANQRLVDKLNQNRDEKRDEPKQK